MTALLCGRGGLGRPEELDHVEPRCCGGAIPSGRRRRRRGGRAERGGDAAGRIRSALHGGRRSGRPARSSRAPTGHGDRCRFTAPGQNLEPPFASWAVGRPNGGEQVSARASRGRFHGREAPAGRARAAARFLTVGRTNAQAARAAVENNTKAAVRRPRCGLAVEGSVTLRRPAGGADGEAVGAGRARTPRVAFAVAGARPRARRSWCSKVEAAATPTPLLAELPVQRPAFPRGDRRRRGQSRRGRVLGTRLPALGEPSCPASGELEISFDNVGPVCRASTRGFALPRGLSLRLASRQTNVGRSCRWSRSYGSSRATARPAARSGHRQVPRVRRRSAHREDPAPPADDDGGFRPVGSAPRQEGLALHRAYAPRGGLEHRSRAPPGYKVDAERGFSYAAPATLKRFRRHGTWRAGAASAAQIVGEGRATARFRGTPCSASAGTARGRQASSQLYEQPGPSSRLYGGARFLAMGTGTPRPHERYWARKLAARSLGGPRFAGAAAGPRESSRRARRELEWYWKLRFCGSTGRSCCRRSFRFAAGANPVVAAPRGRGLLRGRRVGRARWVQHAGGENVLFARRGSPSSPRRAGLGPATPPSFVTGSGAARPSVAPVRGRASSEPRGGVPPRAAFGAGPLVIDAGRAARSSNTARPATSERPAGQRGPRGTALGGRARVPRPRHRNQPVVAGAPGARRSRCGSPVRSPSSAPRPRRPFVDRPAPPGSSPC